MTPGADSSDGTRTPLELVGVQTDRSPNALLLRDVKGRAFELGLDDATTHQLRDAVRNRPVTDNPRTAEGSEETPVGPREIQSLIRSGKSAEEVAEEHNLDLDKVRRFEMPVLMEREHMASRARTTELRKPHGQRTLDDIVTARLTARGDDLASLEWDSWKRGDGRWVVEATWLALAAQIGDDQLAAARWVFDPVGRTLVPEDAAARALMDDDSGEIPTQSTNRKRSSGGDPYAAADEVDDLTAVVRATSDDTAEENQPAWTPIVVDGGSPAAAVDGDDDLAHEEEAESEDEPQHVEVRPERASKKAKATPSTAQPEIFDEDQTVDDEFDGIDEPAIPPTPAKTKPRRGRASVPSWDEILLGTQGPDNR